MLDLIQYTSTSPIVATTLILSLAFLIPLLRKRHLPYPPGPRRLPVIGNLLNMPSDQAWFTYKRWSDDFGSDVVHADTMGSHIIILNSAKAAGELLGRRSLIYSDSLGVMEFNYGFFPYGDRWRRMRHIFFAHVHPVAYRSLEIRAAGRLLRNLFKFLSIAYGIDARPERDPYLIAAEKVVDGLALASTLEGRLLDMIPWRNHLYTELVPGFSVKREARKIRPFLLDTLETPYAEVKAAVAAGTANDSVAAR
ncbi:cytochrome P450 [Multifurca ochricompacta]|uniref:Cytochrome P450 n=1 Tax=Multifurca ochricompacta TaxID=376703 RepID=A0AAD4LYB5_9AGAM|nr:cytochrome P450 [Multifurca ochricompacta]